MYIAKFYILYINTGSGIGYMLTLAGNDNTFVVMFLYSV